MARSAGLAALLFALILATAAAADEDVIPHRQDRPPNKPYSPEEALSKMTAPEGRDNG